MVNYLNDQNKNLLVVGAFMGLLLSIAGNLFITALYDIIAEPPLIKLLILIASGEGLICLVFWFARLNR